jgi:hypothetical protein
MGGSSFFVVPQAQAQQTTVQGCTIYTYIDDGFGYDVRGIVQAILVPPKKTIDLDDTQNLNNVSAVTYLYQVRGSLRGYDKDMQQTHTIMAGDAVQIAGRKYSLTNPSWLFSSLVFKVIRQYSGGPINP